MTRKRLHRARARVAAGLLVTGILGSEVPALDAWQARGREPLAAERSLMPEQEGVGAGEARFPTRAASPPSLEGQVDERPNRLDGLGDGVYPPPWKGAYGGWAAPYRDAMRHEYRRQRDFRMQRRDNWMDTLCPWPKRQPEWSRQRAVRMQRERLAPRAGREAWRYGGPEDTAGPAPWFP